jgi:hypothetical protein
LRLLFPPLPRLLLVRVLALLGAALVLGGCAQTAAGGTSDVATAPFPFEDGEAYTYGLFDGQGQLIGRGLLVTQWKPDRSDRIVLTQNYSMVAPQPRVVVDQIHLEVDAETLKPVEGSRVIVPRAGETPHPEDRGRSVTWQYLAGEEPRMEVREVDSSEENPNLNADEHEIRLREHYYDNESSLWLWRTLAFAEEYDERYVSVNPVELSQTTVNVRIPMRQTVEVPAGTFETWRILVRTGRAVRTAWINVEPPHQVVQWDNGEVIFRLEASWNTANPPQSGAAGR